MKSTFRGIDKFIRYKKFISQFKTIRDGPEICDLYWKMQNHLNKNHMVEIYDVKTGDYWGIVSDFHASLKHNHKSKNVSVQ